MKFYSMINCKNIIQFGGNLLFFLLVLVIMLDPTNTVLHLKDVFFVLLVGYNIVFFKPDFRYLFHIGVIYFVIALCFIIAEIQRNNIVYEEVIAVCKSFSPLILLLWIRHYNVIRLTMIPSIITCIILVILYILCSSETAIEIVVFKFMQKHDDMIMMSRRYFLGIKLFGMYYKSLVCLMFAMFTYFYMFFNEMKKHGILWNIGIILAIAFLSFAFFVSGTRSSMLLPFFMIGFVSYSSISRLRHAKYYVYPILCFFGVLFLLFVAILAMEKTESSNVIKYAHLTSYANLFTEHPLYLLFGQGPGTSFYSIGFGRYTTVTEWTYLEMLRNYGVFCIPMLCVILLPIRVFWKQRSNNYTFGIMGTYIAYLLIAGTNPLLISSTGMLMVLSAYSYMEQIQRTSQIQV